MKPQNNILHEAMNRLANGLCQKLDSYFIEGLRRKGFEFDNRIELEQFIKERCRCEDHTDLKERIYYVDDIPFFLHKYEIHLPPVGINDDDSCMLTANYGHYAYL